LKLPRLYPILDTGLLLSRRCGLEAAAGAMIDAGAGILQIRHKGHWTRDTFDAARSIARLCERARIPLIINDRADIAMLLGAGLHVGQDDLPPAEARRLIGAGAILGYSTHNAEQLQAAASEPASYLALGPMFATRSKENPDPVVGVARLSEWRRLTERPLVAIGGITRASVNLVLEAGADSVAVIGDLIPEDGAIGRRMDDWRRTMGAV
jgi:thiamine-phosphate pyrophosphorylase